MYLSIYFAMHRSIYQSISIYITHTLARAHAQYIYFVLTTYICIFMPFSGRACMRVCMHVRVHKNRASMRARVRVRVRVQKKSTESSYLAQDLLLGGNSCYLYAFRRKLDRLNSRKAIF